MAALSRGCPPLYFLVIAQNLATIIVGVAAPWKVLLVAFAVAIIVCFQSPRRRGGPILLVVRSLSRSPELFLAGILDRVWISKASGERNRSRPDSLSWELNGASVALASVSPWEQWRPVGTRDLLFVPTPLALTLIALPAKAMPLFTTGPPNRAISSFISFVLLMFLIPRPDKKMLTQRLELRPQKMPQPRFVLSLFARILWATQVVDKTYRVFDRLRSRIVTSCATDLFYDAYNDLTFARQDVYRPESRTFRSTLFEFEKQALARHFPSPEGATVLVGAAGGGREAFALARLGYKVVSFEPARSLAASIVRAGGDELGIESLEGRYERLPFLTSLTDPPVTVDLRSRPPFEAAMLGWTSFSHIRSDDCCIETLKQFGRLTTGPILVSYYPADPKGSFSASIGFYRGFSSAQIQEMSERAGLDMIEFDDAGNWPYAVLIRRGKDAANGKR